MQRDDIWFAATPGGDRPVLVLTRDPVADRIGAVVVAALTRTTRGLVSLQHFSPIAAKRFRRCNGLDEEREQFLAEIRRTTGVGGRIRINSNDPAECARKAVSARLRDAIGRIDDVAPILVSHLDRSIHNGLQCRYLPTGDDEAIACSVVA